MLKKYLYSLLAFSLVVTHAIAEEKTYRILVDNSYPPFSELKPNGEVVGFEIDLIKRLCEVQQVKCKLIPTEWDFLIPNLMAKKGDIIIASLTITNQRKEKVAFSDPYYYPPVVFVGATSNNSKFDFTEGFLATKKIGVQLGSSHDVYMSNKFPNIAFARYKSISDLLLDLKSNRLDYIVIDSVVVPDSFIQSGFKFVYELQDSEVFGPVGAAVRIGDTKTLTWLNQAIQTVYKDGSFDSLDKKYFKKTVKVVK